MIENPELECSKCAEKLRLSGKKPLCRTQRGCPIYPLAKSLVLHRLCMGFLTYKRMNLAELPEFLQMEQLRDSGIMEIGYDLLIEFENVHAEYMKIERDKAKDKYEANLTDEQKKMRDRTLAKHSKHLGNISGR